MNTTWWINISQLDEDQKNAIGASLNESQIIVGPPGSGKTNLLLLKADFLQRAGYPNIVILVFTKQLQQFLCSGCSNYSFPNSKIKTSTSWALELLREHDISFTLTSSFEEDRKQISSLLYEVVQKKNLSNIYEYILIDEAQDYLPIEIDLFLRLGRYVYAVGDANQKIYDGEDGLSYLREKIVNVYTLQHHYRNGLNICKLADGIAKQSEDYQPMESTSNYNEAEVPSSVDVYKCTGDEEFFEYLIKGIELQLKAYPNELIGILSPRREELGRIAEMLKKTIFYEKNLIDLKDDSFISYESFKPIVVTTMHSAKGLEFRVLHLCFLEYISRFPKQKKICFTGITRAKTALYIYHEKQLPGYLDQAITNLKRPPSLPKIEDLFKERN